MQTMVQHLRIPGLTLSVTLEGFVDIPGTRLNVKNRVVNVATVRIYLPNLLN